MSNNQNITPAAVHIVGLEVSNVKRLTAVSLTPSVGMNIVGGNNGEGKSSLLDSIAMAIGGKSEMPEVPLRRGAVKGGVTLTTSNGLTIRRNITEKGTTLTVTNADGFKASSPQDILDRLTSANMFDPFSFAKAKPAERIQTLKRLVGLDTSGLDARRKALYEKRTALGKDLDRAKHRAEEAPYFDGAPSAVINPADIMRELTDANATNSKGRELVAAAERAKSAAEQADARVGDAERKVADIEAMLASARDKVTVAKKARDDAKAAEVAAYGFANAFVAVDTAPIIARMNDVVETNKQVDANARRAELVAEVNRLAAEVATHTQEIEKVDTEKQAILAGIQYPITGLGCGDDDVTFNGLPLNQASTAEQIRASVAIGAALNPTMRVMLIRDGSLLDDKSLGLLRELCEQHNLQLFIERVGHGKECSVIIEDGTVYAAPSSTEQTLIPGTDV